MLIAVHNSMLRTEIASRIKSNFPNAVIIEKDNGASALLTLIKESFDLIIIQDKLPILSGIEVANKYQLEENAKEKFILFSESKQIESFQKARKNNFTSYLSKDDLANEIIECVDSVLKGNCFISNSMQELIIKFGELSKKLASLSQTEKLYLHEIKEGKNSQEISDELVLSSKSINQITSSIEKKLEIDPKDESIQEWTQNNKSIFN